MADVPKHLTEANAHRILEALAQKGITRICPRCVGGVVGVCDGFFAPAMSKDLDDAMRMFGEKIVLPMLGLTCNNCGYTSFHSLAVLGLADLFHKEGPK